MLQESTYFLTIAFPLLPIMMMMLHLLTNKSYKVEVPKILSLLIASPVGEWFCPNSLLVLTSGGRVDSV